MTTLRRLQTKWQNSRFVFDLFIQHDETEGRNVIMNVKSTSVIRAVCFAWPDVPTLYNDCALLLPYWYNRIHFPLRTWHMFANFSFYY